MNVGLSVKMAVHFLPGLCRNWCRLFSHHGAVWVSTSNTSLPHHRRHVIHQRSTLHTSRPLCRTRGRRGSLRGPYVSGSEQDRQGNSQNDHLEQNDKEMKVAWDSKSDNSDRFSREGTGRGLQAFRSRSEKRSFEQGRDWGSNADDRETFSGEATGRGLQAFRSRAEKRGFEREGESREGVRRVRPEFPRRDADFENKEFKQGRERRESSGRGLQAFHSREGQRGFKQEGRENRGRGGRVSQEFGNRSANSERREFEQHGRGGWGGDWKGSQGQDTVPLNRDQGQFGGEGNEEDVREVRTLHSKRVKANQPTVGSMVAQIDRAGMDEDEYFDSDSEPNDDEIEVGRSPYFDAEKAKLQYQSNLDMAEINRLRRDQTRDSYRPVDVDPRDTSILLFPGQGSQFVGMGKKLLGYPKVKDMFEMANGVLGYDLLELCLHGPMNELSKTVHCQPAVFVTSLAAVEMMKESNPKVLESCVAATGFSVGEYAALVFSGAMTFEEGLSVVKTRAKLMQRASEEVPSGLMTVFLYRDSKLGEAKERAMQFCREKAGIENPVCSTANFLCADAKVLGGNIEALKFIEKAKDVFDIPRVKFLPVSGAFHTALMKPIANEFKRKLEQIDIKSPLIPVHSNFDASRHRHPHMIKKKLVKQLHSPVKWEQILHKLYTRPKGTAYPDTYELGPGKQLGTLLKTVCRSAHASYKNTDV